MKINNLTYHEHMGKPGEWILEHLHLGDTNLIVGRNSAGKSRTLNVISCLAHILSGRRTIPRAGNWSLCLSSEEEKTQYVMELEQGSIKREFLKIQDEVLLERGADGSGQIKSVQFNDMMKFKIPTDISALRSKRDEVQHPFTENLMEWAENLRIYRFALDLNPKKVSLFDASSDFIADPNNASGVVELFADGFSKHGVDFLSAIKSDMNELDYSIEDIEISELPDIKITSDFPGIPGSVSGLAVKESDRLEHTYQNEMSQGMFRALGIIIHAHYASFESEPSCILVDDIGEGLDFERSTKLINILTRISKSQKIQLVMTTNDKFVMNEVPLEHWTILERKGGKCKAVNALNNPEVFEDFKFTGLNNFSFFSKQFWNVSSEEELVQ